MAVDSCSSDYLNHADDWRTCRDVRAGRKAVLAGRERYLPRIGKPGIHQDALNRAYAERSIFVPLMARTVDAGSGMLMRKPPAVTVPDAMTDFVKDVTADGCALQSFVENVVEEVLSVGRCGLLADHQTAPQTDAPLTVAQATALGLRPFWRLYKAEDIVNARTAYVPGKGVALSMVVLKETVEEATDDEFVMQDVVQYRVLKLVDNTYQQQVWRRPADGADWAVYEEITPLMNQRPMDFIPFVFCGTRNTDVACDQPPLLELAHVNVGHWQTMADYRWALRFVGLPTPVIVGMSKDDEGAPDSLGPSEFLFLPTGASAQYLQVDAQGITVMQSELARILADAASIGARALAPEKSGVESADALSIRAMSENSVLASISISVSTAVTRALRITAQWMGIEVASDDECVITLNRDFMPKEMSAQTVTALLSAVQQGKLAARSLYEALIDGEVIQGTRTWDEEQAVIEEESGTGLGLDFTATDPTAQAAALGA